MFLFSSFTRCRVCALSLSASLFLQPFWAFEPSSHQHNAILQNHYAKWSKITWNCISHWIFLTRDLIALFSSQMFYAWLDPTKQKKKTHSSQNKKCFYCKFVRHLQFDCDKQGNFYFWWSFWCFNLAYNILNMTLFFGHVKLLDKHGEY